MSVHGSHCCRTHGCKYGDPKCSVVLGIEPQEYRQECCDTYIPHLADAYRIVLLDMAERKVNVLTAKDMRKIITEIENGI